jgi:hypothetical protein
MLRYGGAAAILIVLIGLVLFNPFTGGDDEASGPPVRETAAAPSTTDPSPTDSPGTTKSPSPSPSVTPSRTPTQTPARESVTATPSTPAVTPSTSPSRQPTATPDASAAPVSYQNCAEVRAAGKAPLHEGDPGYSRQLDRNGDGIACDHGNS